MTTIDNGILVLYTLLVLGCGFGFGLIAGRRRALRVQNEPEEPA